VAEGTRRFNYGTHDVDDKTWDDAFSKLAEALTGRKDVATVVQRSRMGIISDKKGVLKGYIVVEDDEEIQKLPTDYIQAVGYRAYVKSFGCRDVYFVTPDKRGGGGFWVGFSDDKSLYRWTNYGFFDKLRRIGFVKDLNIVEKGKGEVSVRGFKTRYSCVEVSFTYHPEYINTIQDLLTQGLSEDARAAVLAQWRQRFAVIATFHSLDAALRSRIKYYAYEVDIPSPSEIEIMDRVVVDGLVGFLRQNNRFMYEFPKVAIHLPGRRTLGAPDGIALFEEGKVKGIYHLEVGSEFDDALEEYLDRSWRWVESNVVSECGGGVCLTPLGVALVGFRTDAVGGATVGAMAAGSVADHVKAYPQIKTSLVEWAELLNREAVVRPVIGDYQEVGHGAYRLRLLVLEKTTLKNDNMREAALKAWTSCWK
jgi:uncharacterized protein YifN (PemK superfamily)